METNMDSRPFQDRVDWQCYGCGRLNEYGLQIKSNWEGEEMVCRWQPKPFHVGHPGRLQGGIIATAVICHAVWTATAFAHQKEGRTIREPLDYAYGTTSLRLDPLKPTPIEGPVTLRARVKSTEGDRVTVECSVSVNGEETARAESEHVRLPL
jgi:acyl-coenzyme A thioesterase PaaI-like protein